MDIPAHGIPEYRIPSNPPGLGKDTRRYRYVPDAPDEPPGRPRSDVALQQRRHLPVSRHWNQVHAVECA